MCYVLSLGVLQFEFYVAKGGAIQTETCHYPRCASARDFTVCTYLEKFGFQTSMHQN